MQGINTLLYYFIPWIDRRATKRSNPIGSDDFSFPHTDLLVVHYRDPGHSTGPTTTKSRKWGVMTYRILAAAAVSLAIGLIQTPASAQMPTRPNLHGGSHGPGGHSEGGPVLHVNPRWKECSFQLNSALTQEAWHQFAREAALVAYFRPLSDAKPMGKGRFELSLLQW